VLTGVLDRLGREYGTDKSSLKHHFLDFYERYLATTRDTTTSVLEIGVFNGQSLRMWADYFPAASIVGVDINPDTLRYAADRIHVQIANQAKADELEQVARQHGPFDLIIEDGSHVWGHQILTLQTLFKHVRPGGYYILEDLVTSYGSYIKGYSGGSILSAATYLHALCDAMVADNVVDQTSIPDPFIRSEAPNIEFISYYRYTSLMRRKPT